MPVGPLGEGDEGLGLLWAVPSCCPHSAAGDEPLSQHPSPHAASHGRRPQRRSGGQSVARRWQQDPARRQRGEEGAAGHSWGRVPKCHPAGPPPIPTLAALGTDPAGGTSPKPLGDRVGRGVQDIPSTAPCAAHSPHMPPLRGLTPCPSVPRAVQRECPRGGDHQPAGRAAASLHAAG